MSLVVFLGMLHPLLAPLAFIYLPHRVILNRLRCAAEVANVRVDLGCATAAALYEARDAKAFKSLRRMTRLAHMGEVLCSGRLLAEVLAGPPAALAALHELLAFSPITPAAGGVPERGGGFGGGGGKDVDTSTRGLAVPVSPLPQRYSVYAAAAQQSGRLSPQPAPHALLRTPQPSGRLTSPPSATLMGLAAAAAASGHGMAAAAADGDVNGDGGLHGLASPLFGAGSGAVTPPLSPPAPTPTPAGGGAGATATTGYGMAAAAAAVAPAPHRLTGKEASRAAVYLCTRRRQVRRSGMGDAAFAMVGSVGGVYGNGMYGASAALYGGQSNASGGGAAALAAAAGSNAGMGVHGAAFASNYSAGASSHAGGR